MADLETRLAARPLYLQVRDVLVQRITVGQWKPGGTLPNETLLAQQLGISIGTVRKALDLMELERIVTRRQGRGTFVNDFASAESPVLFSSFNAGDGQDIICTKRGKAVTRSKASAEEAARLGLRRGDPVIKIERIREHLDVPFMTETCLLPERFFSRLPEDVAGYRLSALAQQNAIVVGRADERVSAVSANEADAADLEVAVGTPLLWLDRVIFSDHDDVLEWRVARCALHDASYVVRFN